MNFKVLSVLLLIALISLDVSDAWGRRRRRGGGFFKKAWKVVKKGVKIYNKHKKAIHTGIQVGGAILGALGKDSMEDLRKLKNKDHESYLEMMNNMKDVFEKTYPDEDGNEFAESFDSMVDMHPDELEEMMALINDGNTEAMEMGNDFDEFKEELAMRVADL